jgi:ABC-type branched-subunit amino acid transport system permease subunit
MAPLLTALVPFLLLPALLALLGHASAVPYSVFALAVLLLVPAAQLAVGLARLPILCLGGIAALGAATVALLAVDLGLAGSQALASAPLAGLAAGALLWLAIRGLTPPLIAAVTLALLPALAVLPALASAALLPAGSAPASLPLLLPLAVTLALLLLIHRFVTSPAARLHEAAAAAALPLDCIGLDRRAVELTAMLLAAALAALAGGLLALGAWPVITADPTDWVALSLALAAIGRLGGNRLGAALLAALPLALLPKLTVALAPSFVDLTLAAALAALILHLVIRGDGSPSWLGGPRPVAGALLTPARLAGR